MAVVSTQSKLLYKTDMRVTGATLAIVISAAWFIVPALSSTYTEGFQATLVMDAGGILRGDYRHTDLLYRLDNDFFFATRFGISLALALLLKFGLSGVDAFRVIMIVSLIVLVGANSVILVRQYRVHPAIALLPALFFPGLFESAWFFNDDVLSAALSSAALAVFWTRITIQRTVVAAVLLGLAIACRTDAVLISPAFLVLMWFEIPAWSQRIKHALVAVAVVAVIPISVYAAFGFNFFDVVPLTRRATEAWARTDPLRRLVVPALKGFAPPGFVLVFVGIASIVARRRWREILLCVFTPLVYAIAYGRMLSEVRYLLPLTPFFGILMVEGGRAALQSSALKRRAATIVFGMCLFVCFLPPILLPPRALYFLSTDHDMPRPSIGRFWSPVLAEWWTDTLSDGEASATEALEKVATSTARPGASIGLVISTYWTPDRMVDLVLQEHGFQAARAGSPAACTDIGEVFTRGPERLVHLRAHIPMVPTERERVTWDMLGIPCLHELGIASTSPVLMVGWMPVTEPPHVLSAPHVEPAYLPALDLPWWAGRSIAGKTYAYYVGTCPRRSRQRVPDARARRSGPHGRRGHSQSSRGTAMRSEYALDTFPAASIGNSAALLRSAVLPKGAIMRSAPTGPVANRLLASLPQSDLDNLRPQLVRVRLVREQVLVQRGQAPDHVYFIEDGLALLMAQAEPGQPSVQVGMIGREGMVGGLALLDGVSAAYASGIMQSPGAALRIGVADLRRLMEESSPLRETILRFVQSLTRQVMKIAVSNACNTLAERCVLWLLMAHERVDGDDLPVTHEALSAMLGVRRSGVTVATAALQRAGLIRTSRGRIRILDRQGLEALANHGLRGRGDRDGVASIFPPSHAKLDGGSLSSHSPHPHHSHQERDRP